MITITIMTMTAIATTIADRDEPLRRRAAPRQGARRLLYLDASLPARTRHAGLKATAVDRGPPTP